MDTLNIQPKMKKHTISTTSMKTIASALTNFSFNDLQKPLNQPEPTCCIFKSSIGLILYSSFCVIYLLVSIWSYFKQNSEFLVLVTFVVIVAIPAVCTGIAGLKTENPKLILYGIIAQVIITVWNLVPLSLSFAIIFGYSKEPEWLDKILEWVKIPKDMIPNFIKFLLIGSTLILAFVTAKNFWIIQKMWEFRKWCVKKLENNDDELEDDAFVEDA